ncbi:hypothetical protein BC830DRAFT_787492 [Chytriomyces sp. MP71]|nr:hypothetical protein BC830DRAFT_787492 [Chytriomyces sp. MP71]
MLYDTVIASSKDALVLPIPDKPKVFPISMQPEPEVTEFDEAIHLAISHPQQVHTMSMEATAFPYHQECDGGKRDFGITDAFQVFSDLGTQAVMAIMKKFMNDPRIAQSDNRCPLFMRGLGFVSPFIYNLNNSPQILELVSQLAGEPLAPHSMIQNYAHINVGYPAKDGNTEVDALHADSVDYVLVVMLTDPSNSRPLAAQDVVTIHFTRKGQAMFMRGSQFLHRVRPVLDNVDGEPRITCVFSFMSRNPRGNGGVDATRFGTFRNMSGDRFATVEFARHKAWRVTGLLKAVQDAEFETPREEVIRCLKDALNELQRAVDIVEGEVEDAMPYFDAKKNKFVKRR